jgi:hypothetical protein
MTFYIANPLRRFASIDAIDIRNRQHRAPLIEELLEICGHDDLVSTENALAFTIGRCLHHHQELDNGERYALALNALNELHTRFAN